MLLPYADQAIVPLPKITEYLLNETHPHGGAKAAFFLQLGYRRERAELLIDDLLRVARTSDMTAIEIAYGRKYAGVGILDTPSGRRVNVRTVWVLRAGQPPPLFVTAYPA